MRPIRRTGALLAMLSLSFPSAASTVDGALATSPMLTTTEDPANYVVSGVNDSFSGVAKLVISEPGGTFGCSGALVGGGGFVLTAAHCVTSGGSSVTANSITATFSAAAGVPSINVSGPALAGNVFLPNGWTGDFRDGADLALIRLASSVTARSYDIVRDSNVGVGKIVTLAGYGRSGTGSQGDAPISFGTLRSGTNSYDAYWGSNDVEGDPFAFDFDDGTEETDTIGRILGPHHLGTGALEVLIAPGDSGGPSFLNGMLIGVHSFGGTFGQPYDINNVLDSSFGGLGGDTRVASYANWIDSVIGPVPEPEVYATMLAGLCAIVHARCRRRQCPERSPRDAMNSALEKVHE